MSSPSNGETGAIAFGKRQMDRVVSPDKREHAYQGIINFARQRPLLFTLAISVLAFSFLPIIAFLTFCTWAVIFAVIASVFWIAIALLVLVPILLFTCSVALFFWAWAAGIFVVARWLYRMTQPPVLVNGVNDDNAKGGLDANAKGGLMVPA